MKPFLTISLLLVFQPLAGFLFVITGLTGMISDGGPLPFHLGFTFWLWLISNILLVPLCFILMLKHIKHNRFKKAILTCLHLTIPILVAVVAYGLDYIIAKIFVSPHANTTGFEYLMSIQFFLSSLITYFSLYRLHYSPAPPIYSRPKLAH